MEATMINLNHHIYRCGPIENYDLSDEDINNTDKFRKHIEPWLTAVFQAVLDRLVRQHLIQKEDTRLKL